MLGIIAVFLIIFIVVIVTMTWIIANSMLYNNVTIEAVFTIIFSISYAAMATYIIHILGYI